MRPLIIFISILLASCATPPAKITNTASGNPEVVIHNTTQEAVHDRLLDRLLTAGMRLDSDSPSRIVASIEMTGQREAWMRMMLGNSYSTPVRIDMAFSIIKQNNDIKIFNQASAWTQMPGGQINRTPLNSNEDFNSMQTSLYRLRDSFSTEAK